ncbi:hypothetical protein PINS_up007088 [Pythium insidiosum]|nr:hypothetical protein PINS_up007088 [Pythium insidiosum]
MVRIASTVGIAASIALALAAPTNAEDEHFNASSHRLLSTNEGVNIIVTMKDKTTAPLASIRTQQFTNRHSMLSSLQSSLQEHATKSQRPVIDMLKTAHTKTSDDQPSLDVRSFWISNQLLIRGATPSMIEKLAKHPNVLSVEPEAVLPPLKPTVVNSASDVGAKPASLTGSLILPLSWGTTKIRAPTLWSAGTQGQNVVVGIIDSGARATHESLKGTFRQSYGWFDPERTTANPYDATGHGTHVTGIIAGGKGAGVAPKAQWIACKGCRATGCVSSDLLACMQFMLCPTTADGFMQDCSKAPHIINNSWAGGKGLTMFNAAIDAWKAAGIIPVFAAGNSGPTCGSVLSPGDQPGVITVGAVDSSDTLTSFSGKGPSMTGQIKPDVVAPGNLIRSTCYETDTSYCAMSGTSMATPHVSGAIALLLSAKPGMSFDAVRNALQVSAMRSLKASGYSCCKTVDTVFPNNQYGFGLVDIVKALAVK